MNYSFSGMIVRFVGDSPAVNDPGVSNAVPGNEIHANLWEIGDRRFLDIGVMIDEAETIESLTLDLPWEVRKDAVFDLGSKLDGDRILTAIFNEVVRYTGSSNDDFAEVVLDPENTPNSRFIIVRLHSSSFDVSLLNLPDGSKATKLTIAVPRVPSLSKASGAAEASASTVRRYIRFRLTNVPLAVYTSVFVPSDRTVLSSSVQTRIFDFRINVRRGVPDDVLAGPGRFPRFKKIHLFAILPREREIAFQGDMFKACRSLEDEDIWNNYVDLSDPSGQGFKSVRNFLGYQWTAASKEDANGRLKGAKDLVALARFTSVDSSAFNVLRFLLLGLLVGALSAGVWEMLKCFYEVHFDGKTCKPFGDAPLMGVMVGAIVILVVLSPIRIVACYEWCKSLLKRAFRFVGWLLNEK